MTFHQAAATARAALVEVGISPTTSAMDADLLARHAAGWDLATWITRRSEPADAGFLQHYAALVARRRAREPMAYIRGLQEFWGRDFQVRSGVLIPRPETELLVETALEFLNEHSTATVVDVGTGSGCIAITLALEHPSATIYAVDISEDALAVARQNARRLGADSVRFIEGSYLAGIPGEADLIVSNPPYVAATARPAIPPEVRDFEPSVALFGGDDGMRDIRVLLTQSARALAPTGTLLFEMGDGQFEQVEEEIGRMTVLVLQEMRDDLQGIPRVAVVHRRNG